MAVVALAAYDDMDVGIIGVPVLDPEPIELRGETRSACAIRSRVNAFRSESRSASCGDTMNRK